MTYGSLFSGAGGFDLGFDRAGFKCLWQVEVDETCRAVLARHHPDVPKFRDVTGFSRIPRRHGHWLTRWPRPDVIIGGFPCQDLSVAGQRKGLQGDRSGLFYQFARIVRGLRPRFLVWENVPGLLSSDDGRDFARVLRHLGDCGYHGSWRVLDAQGFGVAQHRRRVFGVFTPAGTGIGCVAEILALTQSVRGDPAAGREPGAEVARPLAASAGRNSSGNRVGNGWNTTYAVGGRDDSGRVSGTLGGGTPGRGWSDDLERAGAFVVGQCHGTNVGPMGTIKGDNVARGVPFVAGTLNASGEAAGSATQQDAENGLLVAFGGNKTSGPRSSASALSSHGGPSGRMDFETETSVVRTDNTGANALNVRKGTAGSLDTGSPQAVVAFAQNQRNEVRTLDVAGSLAAEPGMKQQTFVAFTSKDYGQDAGSVSPTLRAMGHDASHANGGGQVAVAIITESGQAVQSPGNLPGSPKEQRPSALCFQTRIARNGRGQPTEVAPALTGSDSGVHADSKPHVFGSGSSVRRLTPRECERLQGWDDDFTRWRADGTEIADGPRYRMIGNGVAAPVAEWLARRLAKHLETG